MQTKKQSMVEVIINTFTGLIGSFLIVFITLTFITDKFIASVVSTSLCTVWSILRGYTIRRLFNKRNRL